MFKVCSKCANSDRETSSELSEAHILANSWRWHFRYFHILHSISHCEQNRFLDIVPTIYKIGFYSKINREKETSRTVKLQLCAWWLLCCKFAKVHQLPCSFSLTCLQSHGPLQLCFMQDNDNLAHN